MLLLTLLIGFSPSVLGQLEDSQFGDDIDSDLADFGLDIVRRFKICFTFWCLDFLYLTLYFIFLLTHRRLAGSPGR